MDKKDSKAQNNRQRIQKLIQSKQLIIPKASVHNSVKCCKLDSFISKQMSENTLIGGLCGAIVVRKDENKKELILHIIMVYDGAKVINVSGNKFTAFMKDFELKADSSIFTYMNGFKDIQNGTFINAWVRRIEKREIQINSESTMTKVIVDLFEEYDGDVLNRQMGVHRADVRVGVVKDHIRVPDSIMKVYEKQGTFPMNFQMLYMKHFDNPGLIEILLNSLQVSPIGSMHRISNIDNLKSIDFIYERIRIIQEAKWRDQHMEEGIDYLRKGNNEVAIECFNIAKRFGEPNAEVHIAKAIALYNTKNTVEALKQIKEALKIDPNNQRAKNYYEEFRAELTEKPDRLKKKVNFSGYEMVHKK